VRCLEWRCSTCGDITPIPTPQAYQPGEWEPCPECMGGVRAVFAVFAVDVLTRLHRLARALCMEPTLGIRCERADLKDGNGPRWWLLGCQGGDTALPGTSKAHTLPEALEAAEAWLAPELQAYLQRHPPPTLPPSPLSPLLEQQAEDADDP